MKHALLLFVCLALPVSAIAADKPFDRASVVKLLGYDPEASELNCNANKHSVANIARNGAGKSPEENIALYLQAAGENGASKVACPSDTSIVLEPYVKSGETLPRSVCLAAAAAAQDKITVHISEMMGTEPPDLVAGYAEGVATALEPIREACYGDQTSWAKVATQALLIKTRAENIRASKSCTLWRLAVSKELKAAEDIGRSDGKTAGLKHLNEQAATALFGAKHYCGEDTADGLVDANFSLTKMLLDSMPEK